MESVFVSFSGMYHTGENNKSHLKPHGWGVTQAPQGTGRRRDLCRRFQRLNLRWRWPRGRQMTRRFQLVVAGDWRPEAGSASRDPRGWA